VDNYGEILIYQTEDGLTKIDVNIHDETVWLSIDQTAELFQRDKSTILRHIKNVFEDGELVRNSVVANFATTASDGKTYQVDYYNLDVIISVGYRVKSQRGVQFRIWATSILKEYAVSGETAAEVIYHRADAEKDFMGLMSISGDQPTLREAKIAKNYLLRAMGQLVSGYFDFAERQAEREIPMKMEGWAKLLDGILTSTGEDFGHPGI